MSRKELFKNTLRKSVHAWKMINVLRLSDEEAIKLRSFMDQPGFMDLHWVNKTHQIFIFFLAFVFLEY